VVIGKGQQIFLLATAAMVGKGQQICHLFCS
jgi:hypothetical protein